MVGENMEILVRGIRLRPGAQPPAGQQQNE
jgi:hypothetical protein